jgi:hypothetical protein
MAILLLPAADDLDRKRAKAATTAGTSRFCEGGAYRCGLRPEVTSGSDQSPWSRTRFPMILMKEDPLC